MSFGLNIGGGVVFGGIRYRRVFRQGGGNLDVVAKGAAGFGGQVFARGGQNGFVGRAALGFDVYLYRAGGAADGAGVCDLGVCVDGVGFVCGARAGGGVFFGMGLDAGAECVVGFVFGGNRRVRVGVGGEDGFADQSVLGGDVVEIAALCVCQEVGFDGFVDAVADEQLLVGLLLQVDG